METISRNAGRGTKHDAPLQLYGWCVAIGVVGALGAVVFRALIALFHNLFFLGQWSFAYDANVHTAPGPWGPFIILMPVLGAAGVAFLVTNFAPEAKGSGVPEVMDAIYYNKGTIRPVVAVVKSLASALSIGSGGSVGREGPIIQIGSAVGSTMGHLLRLPVWQRLTLIAAGAGAGIAATFNTPIGGVLFAVEIMLHEVSARTLVPVTIATVTASYIGRLCFGNHPSFVIPASESPYFQHTDPLFLVFYIGLGIITGVVSLIYIRSIYAFEDFFERRIPHSYYVRHMLGMLAVGIIMYALLHYTGHYYVQGVGYATVQDVLAGHVSWFLLALFALKLLVTSLTLGSGASGGIFSLALYMGATLGGVYGLALELVFPALEIHPAAFAVAGMAGVVGGSTGAALAAIVMIFEMTFDYSVIIPITVTVALSYGVRTLLHRQSIYTEKLARRGHDIPAALQANTYQSKKARNIMDSRVASVPAGASVEDFERVATAQPEVSCFLVEGPDGIIGSLTRDSLVVASEARASTPPPSRHPATLAELADRRIVTVGTDTRLFDVMSLLRATGAPVALVTDDHSPRSIQNVRGLITKQHVANAAIDGTELFSE